MPTTSWWPPSADRCHNGVMAEVREIKLPGVGVRHEFTTDAGQDIGVLVRHDGRREILVYDSDDPDACRHQLGTLALLAGLRLAQLIGALLGCRSRAFGHGSGQ